MTLDSRIQAFLDDLYAIDPELKTHEEELLPLLHQLLHADPGREPDAAFVQELRSRLQHRATELSSSSPSLSSLMNRFLYAGAGALAALVIAIPAVYYGTQETAPAATGTSLFAYHVTDAPANAFGSLQSVQTEGGPRNQSGGGGGGVGGGGNGYASAVPAAAPSVAMDSAATADAKLVAPGEYGEISQYHYTYSGALPELPEGTVSVLKRERGNRPGIGSILNTFALGNIDLASFDGAVIDSASFSQDEQYGYNFSVMLKEGTVFINQNWEKWPHPENACRDEACYQRYRVKIGELLPDADLLRIAAAFVTEHGIDTAQYGEPEVDNAWRRDYDRSTDKAQYYIPESQQVLYPLLLDGRPVYDQGGAKTGIRVSVSNREKRVSDVWGIQSQSYTRSAYDAVSGSGAIHAFLGKLDSIDKQFYSPNAKIKNIDVTLGEPVLGYVTYYAYDKVPAQELVVPALIFPVTGTSDAANPIWRQNVVVPLAAELLAQNNGPFPVDGPVLR